MESLLFPSVYKKKRNTKDARPARNNTPRLMVGAPRMDWPASLSFCHHILRIEAAASVGPRFLHSLTLSSALFRPHTKPSRYWDCNGGITMTTVDVGLTPWSRSRTQWYSAYVEKVSVWNSQLRQPWRGPNRFCAKSLRPFQIRREPSGMTWCFPGTSSAIQNTLLFLLRCPGCLVHSG